MVKRPLPLRILPLRLAHSVFARFYRGRHEQWKDLYRGAPLRDAPAVKMDLCPGDIISDYIAFTGVYDAAFTRRVVELAARGGTMIDIGANIGYFSLLLCAGRAGNRCYAFEASPLNVERLRVNIGLNEADIVLFPLAVGKSAGRLSFDLGPADQTGWGGFTLRESERSVEVDVVRVDDTIGPGVTIDLLKVDIEGADTWALEGCERLFRERRVGEVWYEQNKARAAALGIPAAAAADFLRSVGYDPRPEGDPEADIVQWVATPSGTPPTTRRTAEAVAAT